MSLSIQTNLSALSASNSLNKNTDSLSTALRKLSSGLKITEASDDPSGLVISEYLKSQIASLSQSMQNTTEANNVLSIAESGLSSIASQLTTMRALALEALNSGATSSSQVSANQAQIDSSLSTIQNIASTTSYAGDTLLDGTESISFASNDPSDLINSSASTIETYSSESSVATTVSFSGDSADQAEKAYVETDLGGGTTLTEDQSFTVTGSSGSVEINAAAGTSVADMADQINNYSDQTGVTAYAINGGTELRLVSNDYGSDESVSVTQNTGSAFTEAGSTVRDSGQDATVSIGGRQVTADGLSADANTGTFTGTIQLTEAAAQTGYDQDTLTDATAASVTISDFSGGMQFQLGSTSTSSSSETFGIESFNLGDLGEVTVDGVSYSLADIASGGSASLANDPELALQIIDQAISDVASQQAAIGAYQSNTLQSNANSLSVAIENLTSTESAITDADIAEQVTEMAKYQLLQKASLMALQAANTNAENVLTLLGG